MPTCSPNPIPSARDAVNHQPRIAIIGAGPIGLEAAVAASSGGFDFQLYERGGVANYVREWGHVTLFTPFSMNHSAAGIQAIEQSEPDYKPPLGDALLTGHEYVDRYLAPLAGARCMAGRVHERHRVVAIGRSLFLKPAGLGMPERAASPFRLLVETSESREKIVHADVVMDCSGIYGQPNCLGHGGIPAMGERRLGQFVRYTLDDIIGKHRRYYEGKHILLIGGGYSAATSVLALRELVESDSKTNVIWLTSHAHAAPIKELYGDRLHARHQLAHRANQIAREGHPRLRHMGGVRIERLESTSKDSVVVDAVDQAGDHYLFEVDRVLANVGYRPDRAIYSELHVHECFATEAPMKLAAALMNDKTADCLDRVPTSLETLINPEPNFFILGAKSFGRDPTFLLKTGIAQVHDVFAWLKQQLRVGA